MPSTDDIPSVFTELARSGSLQDALNRMLRLACEVTACRVAALAVNEQSASSHRWSIVYDPESLLCAGTQPLGDESPTDNHRPGTDRGHALPTAEHSSPIRIALTCDVQRVGTLILWAPNGAKQEEIKALVEPFDTALAVLMSAANGIVLADGLYSQMGFCNRVRSEIARARRLSEEFCVLHIRLSFGLGRDADKASFPWATADDVGRILHPRLRQSDAIGLMAPDRLAILLTTTSTLGARIAQRRIENVLSSLARQPAATGMRATGFEYCIECLSNEANDVDSLCYPGDSADWPRARGERVETCQ